MSDFVRVGSVEDFEDGVLYACVVDGEHVAVVRSGKRFYAMLNACTHSGYFLTPGRVRDGLVDCTVHGAVFRLEDGEPINGPAGEALGICRVRIEGTDVLVAPPH